MWVIEKELGIFHSNSHDGKSTWDFMTLFLCKGSLCVLIRTQEQRRCLRVQYLRVQYLRAEDELGRTYGGLSVLGWGPTRIHTFEGEYAVC